MCSSPCEFYRHVLQTLHAARVPFLVGGAYALNRHTRLVRDTKDLDLFLRRRDCARAAAALHEAGYEPEATHPHWLAKIHSGTTYIDLIFSSGNGIAEVDDAWFAHAEPSELVGVPVQLAPVEEMIWSKSFVMERERYDGADVAHLLQAAAGGLDWQRLLQRFGPCWRVLLAHLVLFGFVYPAERGRVPSRVMDELLERLGHDVHAPSPGDRVCAGTLLSREQYLDDIERQGYLDGRIIPYGNMTPREAADWTAAIPNERRQTEP